MVFGCCLLIYLHFLLTSRSHASTDVKKFGKIGELISSWAPIIWLAPNEKFYPLDVDEFLKNVYVGSQNDTFQNTLQLPTEEQSELLYLTTQRDLESLLEDTASFIYGHNPDTKAVPVYAIVTRCSPNLSFHVSDAKNLGTTINGIYTQVEPYPHFYVAFWTFYPYNQGKEVCFLGKVPTPSFFGSCLGKKKFIGNHVGDWEHVTLAFSGKPYPDRMYLSVHDAGVYYTYDAKSRLFKYEKQITRKGIMQRPKFPPVVRRDKGHPIVFSAYGSHGLWGAPGEHYYVRVPRLYDVNGYGTAWKTWKQLQIYDLAKEMPAWLLFKGKWGNPQRNCFLIKKLGICELFDGPTGILEKMQEFSCFRKMK